MPDKIPKNRLNKIPSSIFNKISEYLPIKKYI